MLNSNIEKFITLDGSIGLYNKELDEIYHDRYGAIKESFEKWNEINGNRINIEKGESSKLELTLNDKDKIFTYPIEKGTEDNINIEINANLNLKAPVLENTNIGKIKVYYNAKELLEIDILNINKINKKRIKNYMSDIFKNYDNYLEGIFEPY